MSDSMEYVMRRVFGVPVLHQSVPSYDGCVRCGRSGLQIARMVNPRECDSDRILSIRAEIGDMAFQARVDIDERCDHIEARMKADRLNTDVELAFMRVGYDD